MKEGILDHLTVWSGHCIAGDLRINGSGVMAFTYDHRWIEDSARAAISHSMPKRAEPYDDAACKAVFGGLLPEEDQRASVARALGISRENVFHLLEHLGGDVAGALTFFPAGQEPPAGPSGDLSPTMGEDELASLLEDLPRVPMLAGKGGARLSLAGAQGKLPIILVDGQIATPREGEASTHLIKPEPEKFEGLAANEAFCLTLARELGLDAAFAEWRQVKGRPFLLVERYDRIMIDGETKRLHQEDFAQALGFSSHQKYAADGGPTFKDSFDLVRVVTTRYAREVIRLLDAAIFNLLIGNADAHAKNYSFLALRSGETVLAPLYDLVSTVIFEGLNPSFAMKFGRASTLEDFETPALERFASDAGMTHAFVRRRMADIAKRVAGKAEGLVVPGLNDTGRLNGLPGVVKDRAERLALKVG
ncbi:type II toxin-antitoxin system HipA family toxin [Croceicoccus gelatinilyticus]|uniref:type II toxin-antitoxin system HipA family toxin n=1 Tax=Croceicoccus gelatinilyticus TaxID=2835536 RepID=UPI001BD0364D|nr:type II toxin-antitoxin system HipA family toxin [Croceicoccus gelatinilyticus]MBS7671621.1 type II toxin-antitoxin system HipA family toxin [Croceicoccus gelatinilyticus]